ncbi:TPA: hypothetical protein P8A47_004843 [Escherichia coli]|nr:hypothetical protein [Salmonella enterica]EEW4980939.1 hypothetical protein [Escherichia coli]EFT7022834.1 hypothetical protein [Salmonella enterica subsp. enterica]MEC9802278.1 hypothetical protein [Escherichia marmotae]EFE1057660.1 hypothetical protein [Escherichia coli]
MIVLMQAMQLKVITPGQYCNLVSLYMNVEDFSFSMVILDKNSGAILYDSDTLPIMIKNKYVACGLGSTGSEFAAHCLYFAERKLRKKRRHRGYSTSLSGCKVTSAVQYAYRRDSYSGGKVYKIIWTTNGIVYHNIPLSNNSVKNHYRRILEETLKIIHRRYEEIMNKRPNIQLNTAATSLSQTGKPKAQSQPHNQMAKASGDKGYQMTISRAINYARLFSE